jgi:hypothetical protein
MELSKSADVMSLTRAMADLLVREPAYDIFRIIISLGQPAVKSVAALRQESPGRTFKNAP